MVGDDLIVDVPSQDNCDKTFGSIDYKVKIQRAPGGRVGGKGRKDKLNVDWSFQCTCDGYKKVPCASTLVHSPLHSLTDFVFIVHM